MEKGVVYYIVWVVVWGFLFFLLIIPLAWIYTVLSAILKSSLDKLKEDKEKKKSKTDNPNNSRS